MTSQKKKPVVSIKAFPADNLHKDYSLPYWVGPLFLLVIFVIMEGIYLSAEHKAIHGYGFGLDDSWIHATIARNLATGNGFSFNPHETMSGSTGPLYTFILAGWYMVFGELVWGAKLIGLISLVCSCFFLYRAAERLSGERWVPWITCALALGSPAFLWSSLNGMETSLYLATICASLFFFTRSQYLGMIIILALGVWLRPEALLLLGIGWFAVPNREKIKTLIAGSIIVLPYFAFNFWLSHYPFPNTIRTKSQIQSAHFSFRFLIDTWELLISRPHFFPIFLIVPLGLLSLWKKAWWAALFPFAFFLATWATSETVANLGRYLYPILPFTFLLIAVGVFWMMQRFPAQRNLILAGAFLLLIGQYARGTKHSATHGLSVENITDMQVSIAKTIPQITLPSDTVATNDVGAMGYFADRYIVDMIGLISPRRTPDENFRAYRPAIVSIFDSWFVGQPSAVFQENYELLCRVGLNRNVVCGDSVMSLYVRKDREEEIMNRLSNLHP